MAVQKRKAKGFTAKPASMLRTLSRIKTVNHDGKVMAFLSKGSGIANGEDVGARTLMRGDWLDFEAETSAQLILIYTN